MKRRLFLIVLGTLLAPLRRACAAAVARAFKVTLSEVHKGTLEVDTRLLDSYGELPHGLRQFYLDARKVFEANVEARFTDDAIVTAAQEHQLTLMGGPMLGDLRDDGVTVWMRPATRKSMTIVVGDESYPVESRSPGAVVRTQIGGLLPNTHYRFVVEADGEAVARGEFMSAPRGADRGTCRIAFGSCCHKIGVHNPNLYRAIVRRSPHAMLLLGDTAVDDRTNRVNMHRADYQLRDVSKAWRDFVSRVPVYASWDDHDYFDNDLSGVPRNFSSRDRDEVRKVWHENWNNPPAAPSREGIYFNTRVGPVEVIMLDTRSCRDRESRGQFGSYLGVDQTRWLKNTLRKSSAAFKVISSGTMWSDYVSNAKDSWGTWDTEAREELFNLVERENIGGVLLVSGDRHGARGFRIPRPSGFSFYEFEPATLGGVSGPAGWVPDCPEQLFGYGGSDAQGNELVAFGEFTFDTTDEEPKVTFRLISQFSEIMEEIVLPLDDLTPAPSV